MLKDAPTCSTVSDNSRATFARQDGSPPSLRWIKDLLLTAELVFLFLFLPLAFFLNWFPVPIIPALLAVTLYCAAVAKMDKSFPTGPFLRLAPWRRHRARILRLLLINGALLTVVVLAVRPEWALSFVRAEPLIWIMVMLLYPLFSALPQEFIYRSFFFHRYRRLFAASWSMDAVNAFAFGFMHIVFDNWVAVALTTVGGWLFARTYRRSGSLLCVTLEHSLYGCFIFTIGLGHFFYEPWSG